MSRRGAIVALVVALTLGATGPVAAKSLYVVASLSGSPIRAYDINPTTGLITYQTQHSVTNYSGGAVDITIDSDTGILFVVYEFSPTINVLDGKTMKSIGTVNMPVSSARSAGIVYDHTRKRLYAAFRSKGSIYSYSWNATTKKLTYIGNFTLSGTSQTYGLDLDEAKGLMYVGAANPTVRYYDVTKNFALKGSMNVSPSGTAHKAVGVAVDATRRYLYSGGCTSSGDTDLCQNNLDTGKIVKCVKGTAIRGLSVDASTGFLYVTTYTGKKVMVFDTNLNAKQSTTSVGNPTGLVVPGTDISYNPLNLVKSDGLDDTKDCVNPGANITYSISYANNNSYKVTNAVITDQLPPEVTFVSANMGGTHAGGKVTWKLGTITAGSKGSLTLVVTVKTTTAPTTVIKNSATIDTDQTPPTSQGDITNVCKGYCGDGKVNGGELCDTAIPAGMPGACPTKCNDNKPCTKDTLTGNPCMAKCVYTPITTAVHGDGCCPPGTDSKTDNDCPPLCGNGILEKGETCDPGITSGPGKCPKLSDCDDLDKCTKETLVGTACTVKCLHLPVSANTNAKDGCCPKGHSLKTDADCPPPCGPDITTNCVNLCTDVKCPPGFKCMGGTCVPKSKDQGTSYNEAGAPIPPGDSKVPTPKTEAGAPMPGDSGASSTDGGNVEAFHADEGCACQTGGPVGSLPVLMLLGLLLVAARRRRKKGPGARR